MSDASDLPARRGRAARTNPPNPYEPLHVEFDPAALDADERRRVETRYFVDPARTILAKNDSPDVPFTYSLNPYRGCEHGCVYCLAGDTLILMADGTTRPLEDIRVGDAIYGTERRGWYRRYVKTTVKDHWRTVKPAYRITLEDGTELVASSDHRFLTERGWKFVTGAEQGARRRPHLTTNNKLMGTGAYAFSPRKMSSYREGYLCGMVRGDGHLGTYYYEREGRAHGNQYRFRLALIDRQALERTRAYLQAFDVHTHRFVFQEASETKAEVRAIRTCRRRHVERIEAIIAWPSRASEVWCKGFLAGIFDAEGCYSDGTLRIFNSDPKIIERTTECLQRLGFSYVVERRRQSNTKGLCAVRLCGGLQEHLRFFHAVDPAVTRKCDFEGQALKSSAKLQIVSIEPLGTCIPLYDITTGTGDFFANGVVSHNCYARPSHEWLGFSAGLDFETRILVKKDAPQLLAEAFQKPSWTPQVVALSGNTDPYQPVERTLELTRRCLQVFERHRNPVSIITKGGLITRDLDVLEALAARDLVQVAISVTSLRAEVAGAMEPRAARPALRLRTVECLAAAGIPVHVNVAPVVPGLTDEELPKILEAVAARGAATAAYTILRLPEPVDALFVDWLERHVPARKDKVLRRLRDLRGGALDERRFGRRMGGEGTWAALLRQVFAVTCRKLGLNETRHTPSTEHFRRLAGGQMDLF